MSPLFVPSRAIGGALRWVCFEPAFNLNGGQSCNNKYTNKKEIWQLPCSRIGYSSTLSSLVVANQVYTDYNLSRPAGVVVALHTKIKDILAPAQNAIVPQSAKLGWSLVT